MQEIKDKVREVKVRSSPHLKNMRAGEVPLTPVTRALFMQLVKHVCVCVCCVSVCVWESSVYFPTFTLPVGTELKWCESLHNWA